MWAGRISPVPARRLHEVTNLKRAGPPRAGPNGPLTTKAPVAAGALWLLHKQFDCVKHSAFSDGSARVAESGCSKAWEWGSANV